MPTFTQPNSDGPSRVSQVMEKWSDAARAAAAAGRKARKAGAPMKAVIGELRAAYYKAGGPESHGRVSKGPKSLAVNARGPRKRRPRSDRGLGEFRRKQVRSR